MAVVIPLATLPTRDDTFLEPGHEYNFYPLAFCMTDTEYLSISIRDDLANAMARVHVGFLFHSADF
jgi:hypothetical protein